MTNTLENSVAFWRIPGRKLALSSIDKGSSTTIFFLHGLGGNRQQWRLQWNYFAQKDVNLVAWDCLAHGDSARSQHQKAFDSECSVKDLAAVLDAFPARKKLIVAHSFGCRLVLEWLANLHETGQPLPINGLILLGPASLAPSLKGPLFGSWLDRLPLWVVSLGKPWLQKRFEKLAWHPGTSSELLRRERRATRRNSLFMIGAVRNGARPINHESLRHISIPTHIVAGEQDGIVPVAEIKKLHALLPASTLNVLSDCGHQIILERPSDVNDIIERELRRISDSEGNAT